MSQTIRELRLLVRANPFVLLASHVGQSTDCRMHDPWQIALDEASVATSDCDLG